MASAEASAPVEGETPSALEDNIARKGRNAYYYAHATNLPGSHRMGRTFGGPPPELEGAAAPAEESVKRAKIDKYGWADGTKNVKVYIDWPGADALPDSSVVVETQGERSATVEVTTTTEGGSDTVHKLLLAPLYDAITGVKAKRNAKRITVTLVKKDPYGWPQLKKAASTV